MVRTSILHKQVEFDLERFLNLESKGITPLETTDENTAFLRHYQDTSINLMEKDYSAILPLTQVWIHYWYREGFHVSLHKGDRNASSCWVTLMIPWVPSKFKLQSRYVRCIKLPIHTSLNKHLSQYNDPVAEYMKKKIYVDDLISGFQWWRGSYSRARTLMTPVGFKFRSLASNNPVIQSLPAKENLLDKCPKAKVQGVLWNTITEMIKYPSRSTASTRPNLITISKILLVY